MTKEWNYMWIFVPTSVIQVLPGVPEIEVSKTWALG
jgi:hypothetical protein